ncbi:hypothetical protein [Xanthocytophaga agilis]|uniref:Uncharacterized protein n=1 Tax=Xanthocytophaga agilis TaxID=3048010 RepID=A0AAE3QZG2_9BACT|nr:hypothetical protein [Xanthocytophaga agilis]MDJ1500315.1 hypothetical protein [Xanthocytophaga agilis]
MSTEDYDKIAKDDNYTELSDNESPHAGDVGTYTNDNGQKEHFEIYQAPDQVNSKNGTEKDPGQTASGKKAEFKNDQYNVIRKRSPHTVVAEASRVGMN